MKRTQLSLFLTGESADQIEGIRRRVDPIQSALIPAHVTLCREDEISSLEIETIEKRLSGWISFTLRFGQAERFHGHGILLNCVAGQTEFHQLREQVLGRDNARAARPHITLAHPRNPWVPGNSLKAIQLKLPMAVSFDAIALIEQDGAEKPWRILWSFSCAAAKKKPKPSVKRMAASGAPLPIRTVGAGCHRSPHRWAT